MKLIATALLTVLPLFLPLFGHAMPTFMNNTPQAPHPATQPAPQLAQYQNTQTIEGIITRSAGNTARTYNNAPVYQTPEDRAATFLASGLYVQAANSYRNLTPTSANRLGLAQAQAGQGNITAALRTLKPLLSEGYPPATAFHADILLHQAETALISGNTTEANRQFNLYETTYGSQQLPSTARYHRLGEQLGRLTRTPERKRRKSNFWGQDATTTPETEAGKTFFRVGVLLPLSGNMAPVGKDLLRAMQLNLFEQQASASNVVTILYPQDTQGTPQGAAAAASRALKLGADMLIGPLAANNVEAAASVASRSNTPLLAFSSTAAVAAPGTHLLGYIPQTQARAAARYAIEQGKQTFAALVPSTTFGYEVLGAFSDELAKHGHTLSQTGFYNPQNADVGNALTELLNLEQGKIVLDAERRRLTRKAEELGGAMDEKDRRRLAFLQKAKPEANIQFDALFLPATATGLSLITAQMATYDADKADFLLLGTAAWNADQLNQNPPEYLPAARFFAPAPTTTFTQTFTNSYGSAPHPLAVLGYDAAAIAQSVATEVHHAGFTPTQALLRPEGFAGQGGALQFTATGLPNRAYATYQAGQNGATLQNPAPMLLPPPYTPQNATPTSANNPQNPPTLRIPATINTQRNRFIPW